MEQVKTDPRVRYYDFVACNAFDITAQLGAITVPTLIIAGRDDSVTPAERAEVLHQGIPGSRWWSSTTRDTRYRREAGGAQCRGRASSFGGRWPR